MRRGRTGRAALAAIVAAVTAATGCAGLGHKTIEGARFGYNEAMVRTWNEQMLLNLVRLRYRDTPLFLEVSSVTAQYTFSGSASAAGTFQVDGADGANEFGAGLGIGYTESPTISYAPLQGERFVTQLLSPVPLETVMMLTGTGWSIDRVMRTCVQQANGLRNAPSASGPTPSYEPEFRDFLEFSKALRQIQLSRAATSERRLDDDGNPVNVLRIRREGVPADARASVMRLLGLDASREEFVVTNEARRYDDRTIDVIGRSLLGVLSYLSQAVEAPERHVELGLVTVPRRDDGTPFDWTELTGDLFRVHSGRERPERAFTAVRYRGHWFWIDDADLESKTTFGLLTQLFNLQAGQVDLPPPALTLSVN